MINVTFNVQHDAKHFISQNIPHITVVPDTNVMISYLDLLDTLVKFSTFFALHLSVLIPGIVLAELDGLRKNQARSCQREAQRANIWVATELQKRAIVRGQKDTATLVECGNWKRDYYASEKVCSISSWFQTSRSLTFSRPIQMDIFRIAVNTKQVYILLHGAWFLLATRTVKHSVYQMASQLSEYLYQNIDTTPLQESRSLSP